MQEVPQQAQPDFTGLQVALKMSLPVFVAPAAAAEPQLHWTAARTADGQLSLTARNDGAAHARIHRFSVTTADGGTTLAERPELTYVLPGAVRQWTFDDNNNTRPNATSTTAPGMSGSVSVAGNNRSRLVRDGVAAAGALSHAPARDHRRDAAAGRQWLRASGAGPGRREPRAVRRSHRRIAHR